MPRRSRLATGGLVYHVLNRRVGRLPLFETPMDYAAFEKVLQEAYEQTGIWIAAQERSLLELGKMGPKAKDVALPVLLKKLESTDRIVRQGVLLAIVHITGRDCSDCSARLTEVIKKRDRSWQCLGLGLGLAPAVRHLFGTISRQQNRHSPNCTSFGYTQHLFEQTQGGLSQSPRTDS